MARMPPLSIARVALYARVSTLNGQDPEMQLSELREYGSRRAWTIPTESDWPRTMDELEALKRR